MSEENKVLRTFMIDPDVDDKLNAVAKATGTSKSELIRMAVMPYLKAYMQGASNMRKKEKANAEG